MITKEKFAKILEAEKEDWRNPETDQKWTKKLRGSPLVAVISLSYSTLFDICIFFGGIEADTRVKAEESYSVFIEDREIKTSDCCNPRCPYFLKEMGIREDNDEVIRLEVKHKSILYQWDQSLAAWERSGAPDRWIETEVPHAIWKAHRPDGSLLSVGIVLDLAEITNK